MVFNEIDHSFYEMKMKDMVEVEKKFKLQRILFIGLLLIAIFNCFMLIYVPVMSDNMFLIVLLALSFPGSLCMIMYLYASYKEMKPYWNIIKFNKHPDKIIVYPDFHMEVQPYKGENVCLRNIHSVRRNYYKSIMYVEYKYRHDDTNYCMTHEITYCIKDLSKIEKLLKFKMELQKAGMFKNTSMKKIFHMEPALRNRLFLEEINAGMLLLPIRLLDESDFDEHSMLLFDQMLVAYESCENGYLCLYTSNDEISRETLQVFPQCIYVDIKRVYMLLIQHQSSLFKEKECGIIINRNKEQVQLNDGQLKRMIVIDPHYVVTQLYENN